MRKHKSEDKSKSVRVMANAALALHAVANATSKIDATAVRLVAKGISAAHDCTKAETARNIAMLQSAARALLRFASEHAATPLPMVRAAENMGAALVEYSRNEYGRANIKAMSAMDNVR